MILILLVLIVIALLIFHWIRLLKECARINVPGPTPLPLLGNAHLFLASHSGFLDLVQKYLHKYGAAVRFHFFSEPCVVISHPKYIEPLLSSMEFITKGKAYDQVLPWLGQSLLTTTGHKWQTYRKFLTPAFHFNILRNYLPVFCNNQKILVEKLRNFADGKTFDVVPLITLATLDNVTETIMGVSVDAQKQNESDYVKSIEEATAIITKRIQIPFLGKDEIFNLLPLKAKLDKNLKLLHAHTNKVIKERSEELQKTRSNGINFDNVGSHNKNAFLDLLLLAESNGKNISIESVREEVDTFMFAGHDTTTAAVSFTIYCLSRHRDAQEKIYEELKSIYGDDMNRNPTFDELNQMKYLELVIKESMRLYSPVVFIERLMVKDCKVGELEFIKGTSVRIDIFHMQRSSALYEDPEEFRPERFEVPTSNPFMWIPFSAGPRNCIGQKFAFMELKVMVSEIVKHFIVLSSNVDVILAADLTLKSNNGVQVKLLERK